MGALSLYQILEALWSATPHRITHPPLLLLFFSDHGSPMSVFIVHRTIHSSVLQTDMTCYMWWTGTESETDRMCACVRNSDVLGLWERFV